MSFLVSYDMYKAYDRVMLSYLEGHAGHGVSCYFINWVLMLHEGAATRFILKFLTDPINVLFSIRQGDPLSMVLYIIYIEPLLMMMRTMAKGLSVSLVDINFVGEEQ